MTNYSDQVVEKAAKKCKVSNVQKAHEKLVVKMNKVWVKKQIGLLKEIGTLLKAE